MVTKHAQLLHVSNRRSVQISNLSITIRFSVSFILALLLNRASNVTQRSVAFYTKARQRSRQINLLTNIQDFDLHFSVVLFLFYLNGGLQK